MFRSKRIQNRILQAMYRPRISRNRFISGEALTFFDQLDSEIDEKITPLLAELF